MDIPQGLAGLRLPIGYSGPFYGVYTAIVTDVVDPDGQGRVKVKLPWAPDEDGITYDAWARLATMMAGADRGTWFIPDVGDEVLVSFEAGDPDRPVVIGALWNGADAPPEQMDGGGENDIKAIHSRNDVRLVFDDKDGSESFTIETPGGHRVKLNDGDRSIEIVDSNGNSVRMEATAITVNAAANVEVNAGLVKVSAGMVEVNAGMSKFSGVVQADTVITNSVISASYTPGAGNIW